jgi:PAS domain S-box-containing protein
MALLSVQIDRAFVRGALVAGVTSVALGSIGLAGWLFGVEALQSFRYGHATMKMNTAVSLVLGGLALILTAWRPETRPQLIVARWCALLVALVGSMTLAEYLTGIDLGIDELLIDASHEPDEAPPGRMAPNTASCLFLIGLALLFHDSTARALRTAAHVASLLVLIVAFLALSGYVLSVDALYGVAGYTSMALPTASALALLAAGTLASRPDRGLIAILAQANVAGATIRHLLPLLVAVPLLLAWLQRVGIEAGVFGMDFGSALTATLSVCLLAAIAIHHARNQGRWESERSRLDDQVRLAMDGAPNGMIIVDAEGRIALANAAIERMFGYSRVDLIGCTIEKLVPAASRRAHENLRARFQSAPQSRTMAGEARAVQGYRHDGSLVPVEVSLSPIRMPGGEFVLATVFDLRQREQLERAAERERFFQLSNDALCISNASGYFVQVNDAFGRILGYTREELLAAPFMTLVHPEDIPATAGEVRKAHSGESVMDFRNRYRTKDGGYRWLQWRAMPDASGLFYSTARDITQELDAVKELQAGLRERSLLLQEVHHRVKNNLQLIASMINMQVRKLRPGPAREALDECASRVQAIGLIHETLFRAKDFTRLPFREYATRLVENLMYTSARSPDAISCQVDIAPAALTVQKAIPCGLIINELVTNAFKHAFPGNRRGQVRVGLRELDSRLLVLTVADDGIGLGEGFELEASSSLGLTLVATLVDQLKGSLAITRAPGASFEITFPKDAHA